jgi:hypothetical protein
MGREGPNKIVIMRYLTILYRSHWSKVKLEFAVGKSALPDFGDISMMALAPRNAWQDWRHQGAQPVVDDGKSTSGAR